MKISNQILQSKFFDLCQLIGVPCGIDQAKEMNAKECAILDHDATNGGYRPTMVIIATGTQYGFMRFSTYDKRLTMCKMFDKIVEWTSVVLFVKEKGFPDFSQGFKRDTNMLSKSDTVTVNAKKYTYRSNEYHSVEVYVNGERVGFANNKIGYGNHYLQTAHQILLEAGYWVDINDGHIRRIGAKVVECISNVNKSQAQF